MSLLRISKIYFLKFRQLIENDAPWSVDRFGRLFSGSGNLFFLLLSVLCTPYFLIPTIMTNLNLVITSLNDNCVLRDLLKKLGAEERERIYSQDGSIITKNNDNDVKHMTERV